MGNMSHQALLEKYAAVVKENKKLKKEKENEYKSQLEYYYNAYKKIQDKNEELKQENKKLKKDKIELSILVDYLRGKI